MLESQELCVRRGPFGSSGQPQVLSGTVKAQARHLKLEFVQWPGPKLIGSLGPLEMCAPSWPVGVFAWGVDCLEAFLWPQGSVTECL